MSRLPNGNASLNPKSDLVLGIVLTGIGASFAYHATSHSPAVAMMPFGVGVLITIISLGLVLRSTGALLRGASSASNVFETNFVKLTIVLGSAVAFAAFVRHIGFFTSSAIYSLLIPWLLGYRNIKFLVTFVSIFILAMYLIFSLLLKYPLPKGLGI